MFSRHSAALIHLLAAVTLMPGKTLNPEITLPKHSAPVCAPCAPRGITQQLSPIYRLRCHSGYGPPQRCGPPRIDYASECGPTSADTVRHSGYDSTIENTTLSLEMTIVDVRSTPVHYRICSSRTKINHDRGGSYTGLLQYIVRVSYN